RFVGQKEPVPRLLALFAAAEALARYLVTLAVADLFGCLGRSGADAALPADAAFDLLRRPMNVSFGGWLAALRAAAVLAGRGAGLVEELPRVCRPGGHFDRNLLGALVEGRNRWAHSPGNIAPTPGVAESALVELRPRLEEALYEARFVCNY